MPALDTIGHLHGGRRAAGEGKAKAGRPTRAVTLAEFEHWLAGAAAGDSFQYHAGLLALDRAVGSRLGEADRRELDRVAERAMALAQAGRVHLVQRRHRHGGDYEYIVIVAAAGVRAATGSLRPEVAS